MIDPKQVALPHRCEGRIAGGGDGRGFTQQGSSPGIYAFVWEVKPTCQMDSQEVTSSVQLCQGLLLSDNHPELIFLVKIFPRRSLTMSRCALSSRDKTSGPLSFLLSLHAFIWLL